MSHPIQHAHGIERRLAEQYINTYCRETAYPDPRISGSDVPEALTAETYAAWRSAGLAPFVIGFPLLGARIAGAFSYFSPIGYHRLAGEIWLEQAGRWARLEDAAVLSDLIAASLAASAAATSCVQAGKLRLQGLMRNSIAKVRHFHAIAPQAGRPAYMRSEQGLRFGHIFHVTSKASDGFDEKDLQAYAPELGASFQLHYFAVRSDLLEMRALERKAVPIDPEAMHFAEALLKEGEYRLLPCHPWQARYLLGLDDVAMLIRDGALISLGPLGERAWPTSSVRTVWLPQQNLFFKLALNIRITNFVRNNPDDHVARALDASAALGMLPAHRIRNARFRILLEIGSETLKVPDTELRAACSVIYRQAMTPTEAQETHLVAALLEEPAQGEIPLLALLRQAAGEAIPDADLARRWWRHYLDVTLIPMLELFADYGVSLEAHLQNCLVEFRDGWPSCGYARDMEGTSISRQRFPFPDRLAATSPALYDETQAWHRFQYYVLVNHIGHVAACLARLGLSDERELWDDAGRHLQTCSTGAAPLVQSLLQQSALPAKANMLSSFNQQGETPSWISIPNPLRK
ncbi:IucA/IucC family protein [Herbaspirillum robiniae]|uniref:Siderophore synthetase n=1 Tax=Herbaspirillum robiniae TaxID=2014887 RepID=A0A246WRS9_9BURK|nr:IucA/IucC family protein [Herbaspirillum robiniae]OWY29123.1 siderophore synthetase [Herbaspirillum robiniae]